MSNSAPVISVAAAAVITVATAGLGAPVGAAILGPSLASTSVLGGVTTLGSVVGGAVVGAGTGATLGGISGSMTGDFGEGALTGAASGAVGGAVGPIAGGVGSSLGLESGSTGLGALTGAAQGAASGATSAAVQGNDIGTGAAIGGLTGGITGALTSFLPEGSDLIKPLVSYGVGSVVAPLVTGGQNVSAPSGAVGGGQYSAQPDTATTSRSLRVGSPELPAEGASIPSEKKLEPRRPVWNISSLRTQEEAA